MPGESIRQLLKKYYKCNFGPKIPLHLNEDISPVFIIGSRRSGNTLLRRVLTNGTELYIPPETYVLGSIIRYFQNHRRMEWPQLCHLVLGAFATSEDFECFPKLYLSDLYRTLLEAPSKDRSLSRIITSFYECMMSEAKPKAIRWGDKTPMNSDSLDEIDAVFPRAQYIHIVRNGYDVVASYLKMGRYTKAEDAATRWVSATKSCNKFSKKHPDRVKEFFYEDLVSNPSDITKSLCTFLRLTYNIDMIQ